MKFRQWLENQNLGEFKIPIPKLYGSASKIQKTIHEILLGKLSHSNGEPIIVSRLDNPRGTFFMIDGYHRVVEGLMKGETTMDAIINIYCPRIERTGGAFKSMVDEKMPMTQAMALIQNSGAVAQASGAAAFGLAMPQNHYDTSPSSHAQNPEGQQPGTTPN